MGIENKTILVTGAAGFIGSHLCDALCDQNIKQLIVLDNLYLGKKENLEYSRDKNINLVELLDPKYTSADFNIMKEVFEKYDVDYVFDLATIPLPASLENPKWCFEEITKMALNLCELARLGYFKTLIHCSTSEVYGTAEMIPMTEEHPWNSRTSYAAAKGAADLCIKSYVATYDIDAVIIRPFNNYGPRQNDGNYAGVIPIFINNALQNIQSNIFGDGMQSRDFTYVSDTARGFIELANSNFLKGEVINLSAEEEINILNLGNNIYSHLNQVFSPTFHNARIGDVQRHISSSARMRQLTDFVPAVSIDKGIKNTIEWYKMKLKSL
jgi:UDP-glucose 4-epimerase